ncbi:hypothetical protein BTO20_06875 [Mycobacterium dioxanotrophicus]|jgi:hypothetical protein|uniref:DUF91 domain-containing protein n=1 Tax=Mycobacterium dioxanotrophicus TaxID=482462 RepID=A0A1Y0BZJ0_9MYCO|nr:hypothetical protein [Mycobacterium dioxanotrophicus]ART68340.1 hypothetical protein BTO20_06875 [Mycobacterium dioxanotrophicus]
MPKLVSKEERLERLVAKARKRVEDKPEATRSLSQSPDSKLGTLVREAGYERSSAKLLQTLEQRLMDCGIATYPELTDPSNTSATRIHFFDRRAPVPGYQLPRHLFDEEKQLSRFLFMNKDVLPYCKKNNLQIRGPEVRIAGDCRIDLLAVDKKSDELVGFELKAGNADQGVVVQAAKYMKALLAQAKSEGRPGARLLIVTGQPDERLAELVQDVAHKYGVTTSWLLYSVRIDLTEIN